MISTEQNQRLWKMIKGIKVAMMTTEDADQLRSRPMYLVQDEFDGRIWLFNNPHSHKTVEVQQHARVNLSFADVDNDCYVSLSGVARVSTDQSKIDELWNPMVEAWFAEGKHSPEVSLLEIEVTQAEYWDTTTGKVHQLYEMAKANFSHKRPDVGEHQRYS